MPRIWVVIPAAGIGRRMNHGTPKQYLPLRDRTVIEHTLERVGAHDRIDGVVVSVRRDDRHWPQIEQSMARAPQVVEGGKERYLSVRNALRALMKRTDAGDWVLVHDAVRPCVRRGDIDRLITAAGVHADGGVLGVPVRDTMKRTDHHTRITETVSREDLWHAHTPQMFRLGRLSEALDRAQAAGRLVTDEAQAMEAVGAVPLMVEGSADNIKITRAEDLELAALFLARQERGE